MRFIADSSDSVVRCLFSLVQQLIKFTDKYAAYLIVSSVKNSAGFDTNTLMELPRVCGRDQCHSFVKIVFLFRQRKRAVPGGSSQKSNIQPLCASETNCSQVKRNMSSFR